MSRIHILLGIYALLDTTHTRPLTTSLLVVLYYEGLDAFLPIEGEERLYIFT